MWNLVICELRLQCIWVLQRMITKWPHLAFSALGKSSFGLGSPKAPRRFLVQMLLSATPVFGNYTPWALQNPSDSPLRLTGVILSPNGRWGVKGGSKGAIWERRIVLSTANTSNLDSTEDNSSNKSTGLDLGCHRRIQTRLKHEGLPWWKSIPRAANQKCPKEQVNLWSAKLYLTHIPSLLKFFGSSDDSRD